MPPTSYPSPSPRALAADAVYAYLSSLRGRNTPLTIKARLLVLDWQSVGARPVPTPEQVHWTRCWLEDNALLDARRHLADVRAALRRAATADNDGSVQQGSRVNTNCIDG